MVANAANLKCSIVEVVGRVGNKVGDVVTNSDMVVGPLVSKDASSIFHQHPHSCICIVTPITMGNCLLHDPLYRYGI